MTGPFLELPNFSIGCGYPLMYVDVVHEEKNGYTKIAEVYNLGPDVTSSDVLISVNGFYYFS
jgi:hypothetical protein